MATAHGLLAAGVLALFTDRIMTAQQIANDRPRDQCVGGWLCLAGGALGAIGLLGWLIERRRLERENARLDREARRALQVRDEVLGIVAHDLRNPLGNILFQASLLRRRGPGPERRSTRPAETIERAATHMNRLIQDLLEVTRVETGSVVPGAANAKAPGSGRRS